MDPLKQIYFSYWKQLKLIVDDQGLDWRFYSLDEESECIVKIGSPHYKVCLSLAGPDGKSPLRLVSAGFWIPDDREAFLTLRSRREEIEKEMGRGLVWDIKSGRKSCWIRIVDNVNLTQERDRPRSFEWFVHNAQKLRDVCHQHFIDSQ